MSSAEPTCTGPGEGRAYRLHCQPVAQQGVVPRLRQLARRQRQPGCEHLAAVATVDEGAHFIHGDEVRHLASQLAGHRAGIVGESLRGIAILPTTLALQRFRKIPVIQRAIRLDARRKQCVDQLLVVIDTLQIGSSGALGKDARPGDRETVGPDAQIAHQGDVLGIAMVGVVGVVAVGAAHDAARLVREHIPDRGTPTVDLDRAFHLVGCRRRTPDNASGTRAIVGASRRVGGRNVCGGIPQRSGGHRWRGTRRQQPTDDLVELAARPLRLHAHASIGRTGDNRNAEALTLLVVTPAPREGRSCPSGIPRA